MSIPVKDAARIRLLKIIVESAYKQGFEAGMQHDKAVPLPWDAATTAETI